MRNNGTMDRDEMEARRFEAAKCLAMGMSQSQVARRFDVSRTTTSIWDRALAKAGGEMAVLRKRKTPGRPSRLTTEQKARLIEIYHDGASKRGFCDDRWTSARLTAVIDSVFGVRYDHDHVGRMIHYLTGSIPQRRRPRGGYLREIVERSIATGSNA